MEPRFKLKSEMKEKLMVAHALSYTHVHTLFIDMNGNMIVLQFE